MKGGILLKHIIYNIIEIIRKEKIIFFVMCVCILASTFVLNFSYGIFYNYTLEKYSSNKDLTKVSSEINKENAPTHKQVQEFVESLSEETRSNIRFYFSGYLDEYASQIESRFVYRNGSFALDSEVEAAYKEGIADGRSISSDDEKKGSSVAVIGYNTNGNADDITKSLGDGETYLTLFGKKFDIIGKAKNTYVPIVPFMSIPDNFVYDDVFILTSYDTFTRNQYNEIVSNAELYMPGAINFPELSLPDLDSITLYNNIIVIAILLSFLSVLNFSILFCFILKKNNRNIAILRICGCSKFKAVIIHMGECFAISIPIYLVGIAGYIWIFKKVISKLFDYIENAYSPTVYLMIFITYFAILAVVMLIVIIKQINTGIINEWEEGKI
jgi:hypothetical protein